MTPSAMPPFRMNGDVKAFRSAISRMEARIIRDQQKEAEPAGNRKERRRQKALARKRS
jgi:hypothetical protein